MSRWLVGCHDAGGAEVVAAWVKKNPLGLEFAISVDGPALKVFQRKLGSFENISRAQWNNALSSVDRVLTGTGWASDFEFSLISASKKAGIPVASYLDHWVNYRERFVYHGNDVSPDEYWVGDEYAQSIAIKIWPQAIIKLVPNQYLLDVADEIKGTAKALKLVSDSKSPRILYVTEPTSTAAAKQNQSVGYTEFEALEGFFKHLEQTKREYSTIRVRPHPSESPEKYDQLITAWTGKLRMERSKNPLIEDCAWADWIVGCDSMVMAIGVAAGKKVFCSIPKNGRPMALPFREIVTLFGPHVIGHN